LLGTLQTIPEEAQAVEGYEEQQKGSGLGHDEDEPGLRQAPEETPLAKEHAQAVRG
jgi:hypothetical protein